MYTGKYRNRLEKLFSNFDPVEPEPLNEGSLRDLVAGKGIPNPAGQPLPDPTPERVEESPAPDAVNRLGAQASPVELAMPGPIASPAGWLPYAPLHSAWGVFLDGIRRQERLEYRCDPSGVQEGGLPENACGDGAVAAPIRIGDEEIGQLLLGSDPAHAWTAEDLELVNAVSQQLAQQIEALRLLDEAGRSRGEAEQAYHRLTDQPGMEVPGTGPFDRSNLPGWKDEDLSLHFALNNGEVQPGQPPEDPGERMFNAPIRAGGAVLGELQVGGAQELSTDDASLVETVAQRLGHQVESLRLLEESHYFQNETEEAIRRLTYQSWQAYLATTAQASLGFQYDRSRVQPLDLAAPLPGLVYPLKVREETIGRLAVESPLVEPEDAAGLINVISDRLSAHLDGLRLSEQREQALTETEVMYSVSSRLSTAQTLEDALSSVSEPARAVDARDSRLFITTLDERGLPEGLTLSAIWYPEDGAQIVPVNAHFLLSEYPAYWQLLKDASSPLLIDDTMLDPRLTEDTRNLLHRSGARAAAVLPLTISGRWVGVIFINWEGPRVFSEQENRLYSSLARQAAIVVNNRLLLDQTRKRAQELQTVAQVSTAASTILDPQELLQSVVDLTKASFGLYYAQVYLYRVHDNILEAVAGSGVLGRNLRDRQPLIPFEAQAAVARAARERQVLIINDVQAEPGYTVDPALPDVRSEICLPMVVGDRLLGIFNVQSSSVNRFSREDARIYTTLASQVAVALQNAELYAEQAATVERLRELDHLKSAFLANMSHELRTPLNSILGFSEVLLLGLDGPLNEVMVSDIHLIEKNGKHLLSLINDVLDMAKIEAGKMNLAFEKFLLRDVLEEAIDITSSLAREKSLYLVIDVESQDRMELVADRVRLRQVLINVVANAVKFTEKGGITISVLQFPEECKLHIYVRDTGIGIPKDKLESIFDSFSQVDTSTTRKAGGTGLGLPISRRLVEMHGGRLWAESAASQGEGSLLTIELPFEARKQ